MQETVTESSGSEPQPVRRTFKRLWFWFILLCLLFVGTYFFLNRGGKAQPQAVAKPGQKGTATGTQATPVLAVPASKGDMGVYLTGLGNVTPLNTVTVKSRVDGQLMEVHYREGQNVRKGDLLAVIDPRPFQVQLAQAEGQMARDRELLNNARLDLRRFKELWDQDSISRQQYDTQEALVRQLEGSVKVDQGQIDSARLQLTYSRITAPIGGRVGLRLMDAGNIVHANDPGGLVVITQVQPITVVFPIPEDSLPSLLARVKKGARLTVEAFDREQKQKLASGELLTVDNQIDPTTGTVKLKAVFPNSGNELFPNQFVNARLLVETRHDTVIVPAAAIQRGPQGTFVYVVNADKTVGLRTVTIGVSQGSDTSVTKGLEPGELVVADGAERLREGSKVEPKEPGGPKGPGEARKDGGSGSQEHGSNRKSPPP
jgi:multidrug efflux system membrane fusion protein